MIITVGKFKKDGIGTFLLQKNPNTKTEDGFNYVRETSQFGKAKGKYIERDGYLYFQLMTEKSNVDFIDWARKQNMDNYNFIHESAVCPTYLKAFDKAFRDLIQGEVFKKIIPEDIEKFVKIPDGTTTKDFLIEESKRDFELTATVAPIYLRDDADINRFVETFEAYGIDVCFVKRSGYDFKYAYEVELSANMPIIEFFQKLYVLLLYLTIHLDIPDYSKERISQQVERIANTVASDWITDFKDTHKYLIKPNIRFYDEVEPHQKEMLLNMVGQKFADMKELKEAMTKVFGYDDAHMNEWVYEKIFRYKNVFNRLVRSLSRHSRVIAEKFKMTFATDAEEEKLIKSEFDISQFGQLHKLKHKEVLYWVEKETTKYALVKEKVLEDRNHTPFKKLSDDHIDFLLKQEFKDHGEFYAVLKNVIKLPWLYKMFKDYTWFHSYLQPVNKSIKIADYGCGSDAKLTKALFDKGYNVTGFDASLKAKDRYRKTRFFNHMNILYPKLNDDLLNPDVLLSIEVIEHLEEKDRYRMLKIIRDVICPEVIILSTPNIEYNKLYENMKDKYRHRDHKIEFNTEEFQKEVIDFLNEGYHIEEIDLESDKDIQQSFFIVGKRKKNTFDNSFKNKLLGFYEGIYLPYSGYKISNNELMNGYASQQFIRNRKNIFYAGTTIAPVEYTDESPNYLEHPRAAVKYYLDRGVKDVVVEKKYMGSRAYILAFKTIEVANKLGFDELIVINSRGNHPFFENVKLKPDSPVLKNISKEKLVKLRLTSEGFINWKDLDMLVYDDIKDKLTKDVSMFDAEITPWSIKGDKLINKEFRAPVEMSYLKSRIADKDTTEARNFLSVLDHFAQLSPLEIRLFGLIADANLETFTRRGRKGKPDYEAFKINNIRNGFFIKRDVQHTILNEFNGDIVKPVEGYQVDLNNVSAVDQMVKDWVKYCEKDRGEGFVIKLNTPIVVQSNGHLITPMLKVRGREYLRIIYGYNMYQKDFFEKLKFRRVRAKRVLSVHQTELSMGMLNSFMRGHVDTKNHYLGAFLGIENINYDNIDKTL
jgi:2-polyprenyl-3-methyl-5-hydroxy-6-metoxy-1,4-benzoquinol methylase